MGELVTAAQPYFHWATRHNREPDPRVREEIARNQISALHATATQPHIKARLGRILNPNPEGSANANV